MKKILFLLLLISFSLQKARGQCNTDRHSTSWYDGWVSCQKSNNPNSEHGITHWVLYDLGDIYALSTTKFWNSNDPNHLNYGIQEMIFDYSIDGSSWTSLGSFTFSEASGKSTYEGIDGPDFDNILARFVLLTPTSNYGGSCYGFGELKINIGDAVLAINPDVGFAAIAFPNPFNDEINIRIDTLFPNNKIEYSITDLLGRTILFDSLENLTGTNLFHISNDELNLSSGIYLLNIFQNNQQQTIKIVKK